MFAQTTTHATLLARVASGQDPAAWRDFCDRYGELIRGFALRKGLQASDCDDILQDVLIALSKAMPGFQYDPTKGKFRSYLKTVVLRAIFRKSCQKRGAVDLEHIEEATRAADHDLTIEKLWEDEWRQHHLRQAMRIIAVEYNDADRAAFQAYAIEGAEVKEAAERLGLSVDQVYKAKSRIVKRLQELIEKQIDEEG